MGEKGRGSWRRMFNRNVGVGATVVGLAIILSSFFFLDNIVAWYATIMIGLLIVLGGFLYAAYPVLTSERRYFALRREVEQFIKLVRKLNDAAKASESEADVERIKSKMAESIDRMASLAGKESRATPT
ncbi:MAG: hypothetical protein PVJ43_08420 [Gemmatimonadales bacterium]|jgi:hypothetical protein